jgi:predicted nucleic acid-binding protein
VIDTSAMVAALVAGHEHHTLARPHLSPDTRVPAIVLAEVYSQLRRTFGQPAANAAELLRLWTTSDQSILATPAKAMRAVFSRAVELDLGGNIHDAVIAQTCLAHRTGLVTLDGRQHRVALALGVESTYLLA